ncbi:MAG: ChaN family lipoprotein [Bacteroidales bacterium]|nr:ChaN family lipoprotein [Bacteroidales bacterium]
MKNILTLIIIISSLSINAQKVAFKIFEKGGKESSYEDLYNSSVKQDIIMFGELHDDAMVHWLQYELTADLYKKSGKTLILGAEMFEADNQTVLDEYLQGKTKERNFLDDARLWSNYKTDYRALVEFAKENKLAFIATNIPRRYAALVNSGGFEALDNLSNQAKQWMAPLPPKYDSELSSYKKMLEMMGSSPGAGMRNQNIENFPKAQAIKDATMAHFILKNYEKGKLFVHYQGAFHSDDYQGIVWYLNEENKNLKILSISVSRQDDISKLDVEYLNKADYIIVVPNSMTKTH